MTEYEINERIRLNDIILQDLEEKLEELEVKKYEIIDNMRIQKIAIKENWTWAEAIYFDAQTSIEEIKEYIESEYGDSENFEIFIKAEV